MKVSDIIDFVAASDSLLSELSDDDNDNDNSDIETPQNVLASKAEVYSDKKK